MHKLEHDHHFGGLLKLNIQDLVEALVVWFIISPYKVVEKKFIHFYHNGTLEGAGLDSK